MKQPERRWLSKNKKGRKKSISWPLDDTEFRQLSQFVSKIKCAALLPIAYIGIRFLMYLSNMLMSNSLKIITVRILDFTSVWREHVDKLTV